MANVGIYQLTDTWNDGATTFNGIKLDVTDTASAADSKLLDLQVGGVSRFSVDKDGGATLTGSLTGSPVELGFALGSETANLAIATGVVSFHMPFAMTLTDVKVEVVTAPTGSVATFDLNEAGTSVLSTKVTIDATEKTSGTAATPPVVSDSALAEDALMTVDIDGIGATIAGAGAKIWLIGTRA